jgi:NAD(P)-dependent dehydrogenase (short-subunit alcohol dehydrogenase family)
MTTTDLAGPTALITGAARGIGQATALALGQRGAHTLVSAAFVSSGQGLALVLENVGSDS